MRKTFTVHCQRADGSVVSIVESPSVKNGKLTRNFVVKGLKRGERISLGDFSVKADGPHSLEVN